jgi:hypothetical protein
MMVAGLNAALCWLLLLRADVGERRAALGTLIFAFGTVNWYTAIIGTTLSGTSLVTGSDPVLVTAAPTFDVDFKIEPDAGSFTGAVDYVEVTVFELLGGALAPIHVYVTTEVARDPDGTLAAPIQIDGSQLATGIDYVLQIRSVRGAPIAARGDFETVTFPQAMATMFTRTFRLQ